ncbi:MAG: hypothetical protein ACO1N3_01425 [Gammaproteobacteria bacterium]
MQSSSEIQSNPFYSYAEYALTTIRERFPLGAGNLDHSSTSKTLDELIKDISKFIVFAEHPTPNAIDLVELIEGLTSASADIMTCYALGALRLKYSKQKSLFNCIYIQHEIKNDVITTHKTGHTHSLLVLGAKADTTSTNLLTENPNALICDLWSQSIYTVREFYVRRIEDQLRSIIFLWCNIRTLSPVGIYLYNLKPLQGTISIFPLADVEMFFRVLQEMVIRDRLKIPGHAELSHHSAHSERSPITPEISRKPRHDSRLFATTFSDLRIHWETKHSEIIGYVNDESGTVHSIHIINDTGQYAYWNPEIHAPTFINFEKAADGTYMSALGMLISSAQCFPRDNHGKH